MSTQDHAKDHTALSNQGDLDEQELRRLKSVASYGFADSELPASTAEDLAGYANFARELTAARFAAVNIVGDTYQQTIAGTDGVDLIAIDRADSICGRVLSATDEDNLFVTGDASHDPDLRDNPWVSGVKGNVRFYAGAALTGTDQLPLGMLCVYSTEPLTDEDAERAGRRLLPMRDGVVAILEAHRRGADHPTDPAIDDDRAGETA